MTESIRVKSERELKERLEKRRKPLKKPTYAEEVYKRNKKSRARMAAYKQRGAQQEFKLPETRPTSLIDFEGSKNGDKTHTK